MCYATALKQNQKWSIVQALATCIEKKMGGNAPIACEAHGFGENCHTLPALSITWKCHCTGHGCELKQNWNCCSPSVWLHSLLWCPCWQWRTRQRNIMVGIMLLRNLHFMMTYDDNLSKSYSVALWCTSFNCWCPTVLCLHSSIRALRAIQYILIFPRKITVNMSSHSFLSHCEVCLAVKITRYMLLLCWMQCKIEICHP